MNANPGPMYTNTLLKKKKIGFAWYLLKYDTIRFQNDSNLKNIWWETISFTDIGCNYSKETIEILKT